MNKNIRIFFLIGLVFIFYQYCMRSSVTVFAMDINHTIKLSDFMIGMLSASFYFAYIAFQIPFGILIDRIGAKKMLLFLLLGFVICMFLFSYSQNSIELFAIRISMGIFGAATIILSLTFASKIARPEKYGYFVALGESMGMLGGGIGVAIISWLLMFYSWRISEMLLAIPLLLIWILCFYLFLKSDKEVCLHQKKFHKRKFKFNSQVILLGVWGGLIYSVVNAFAGLWSIPYLMMVYHFSLTNAANFNIILFFSIGIGTFLMSYLAGKFGVIKILLVCNIGLIVTMILLNFKMHFVGLIILFIFLGLLCSSYVLIYVRIKSLVTTEYLSSTMAVTNVLCGLVGALFQPLIGVLIDKKMLSYGTIFHFFGVLFCIALIILVISMVANGSRRGERVKYEG